MGPMLCFWYDQRTVNKAMWLFSNFHTNRAKLIECIQYLSMKISSILKICSINSKKTPTSTKTILNLVTL
jgi:hypothetical protein